MKIIIVSGGTGGHIYPGIALAQEINKRDPNASILFIGSEEGMEKALVEREGFSIQLIRSRALLRKLSYKAISAPFVSLIGCYQALRILIAFHPHAVISTGGYASLPVILAATCLGVPVILLEQNVLPGVVNRIGRFAAQKVFLSFPESLQYIPGEVSGNPVRQEILHGSREAARQKFNFSPHEKVVLVMGGSQGSKKINETVLAALEHVPANINILHIIGERDSGWVNRYLEGKNIKNYRALPYVHDMSDALAAADLAVSRAGATAIAEFLVRGLPMVLIPFPYASGNHQYLNAMAVVNKGAAVILEEKDLSANKFIQIITDKELDYAKMSTAAKATAQPQAAERIVDHIYARL